MELTVDQALEQGVAAHKEAKLEEAERLYRVILRSRPLHPDANHNLGVLAVSVNKADAALPLFKTALEANPKIEQFWLSYIDALIKEKQFENAKEVLEEATKQGVSGERLNILKSQFGSRIQTVNSANPSQKQLNSLLEHYQNERHDDAEKLAISITQAFPEDPFAWKVLGVLFGQSGRNSEASNANQKAVELSPQDTETHNNLSITLKVLGRLDEAEASLREAIGLKPDYAEAHNNLGIVLKELGRIDEAEASLREAIGLKPDYAEAHSNLGVVLKELGRLDEAEASLREAIALKPDYAEAHSNLGRLLYQLGYKDSASQSIENANDIDPESKEYQLLLSVMKSRKYREESGVAINDTSDKDAAKGLASNPFILNRLVEEELIATLYGLSFSEIEKTKRRNMLASGKNDARYGNGKCSVDFNLFQDSSFSIQRLAEDLMKTMMEAVESDVYIYDSFFNILGAGGGSIPHNHITALDKDIGLGLGKQKYSLVYYLSVGDQDCSEPGVLKLYEPVEDVLPSEGMIVIIPASRMHSAVYGGQTDRVLIGVNFYSL